jgi:hypothetical protein
MLFDLLISIVETFLQLVDDFLISGLCDRVLFFAMGQIVSLLFHMFDQFSNCLQFATYLYILIFGL